MSEFINNVSKERKAALKKLIKRLHAGEDFETVRADFEKDFSEVSTEEISAMEGELIEEGMQVEEIQRLCDVHANVFGGSISDIHSLDSKAEEGHPLKVLKDENDRIERLIQEEIEPYLEKEGDQPVLMLRIAIDRLHEINKHYARKEQLFFPYLEKKGITAPPKVMWGVDDEIRAELKALKKRLDTPDTKVADVKDDVQSLMHNVREMVFKENNILIPLLSDNLNLYNFITIAENSDEVGYFLEAPKKRFENPGEEASEEDSETNVLKDGEVAVGPGSLSIETLNAMLNTLPLDLTFVDMDGYVKYFTTGEDRIFDRPATIIGRHVNQCHPPASVHVVEQIVNAFKSGKKDHEDFWIQIKDKFVHIRYFAVRNKDGKYLGTLEMTQDIAPLRALEGEKRLISDD
ncbi:MAG: DUF438 domain-containing protein [Bacillota bacterium]